MTSASADGQAALDCRSGARAARLTREVTRWTSWVASAVAHWGPRFTTNGVTTADFERITGGIERWDDWCAAWAAEGAEHEALGRRALAEGRARSAGAAPGPGGGLLPLRASSSSSSDLDQMRAAHERAVACLTDALPHLDPPGRRIEMPFEGTPAGRRCCACPTGAGPHPVVADAARARLHQGGAAARPSRPSSTAGWRPSRVDGPGQGEAEYDLPIRGDWAPVGRGGLGGDRHPARPGPRAGSPSGGSASAATTRRASRPPSATAVPRLRRAGRALQLRRVLGRPARS